MHEKAVREDEKRLHLSDRLMEGIREYKDYKRDMAWTKEGIEIIWTAAKVGDEETFKQLAALFPNCGKLLSIRDKKGRTPIHLLCKNGCLDVLKIVLPIPKFIRFSDDATVVKQWVLSCGLKLHTCKTKRGYTPLHYAIIGGHRMMVEYLLLYCSILETTVDEFVVQTVDGEDALSLAWDYGWSTIYHLLKNARLPFDNAVKQKREDIARRIRDAKEAKLEAVRQQELELQRRAEERRQKREAEEAKRQELIRQKLAAEKAEADLERAIQIQAQHAEWMRAISVKAGLRNKSALAKKLLAQEIIATDVTDVDAVLQMEKQYYMDAKWREEHDVLPGDPTEWNHLLWRQRQDIIDEDDRRARVRQREARRLTYPRIGIELSERVRFGRLGDVKWAGLRVVTVETDSPAARAGLQKNDLLTAANDEQLEELAQVEDLVESGAVRGAKALEKITFTVRRAGEAPFTVTVAPSPIHELQKRKSSQKVKAMGCLWEEIQTSKISSWDAPTHGAKNWEEGPVGHPWRPAKFRPEFVPTLESAPPTPSLISARSRSHSPHSKAPADAASQASRGTRSPTRKLFTFRPDVSVASSLAASVAGPSPGPSTVNTPQASAPHSPTQLQPQPLRGPLAALKRVPSTKTPPSSARGGDGKTVAEQPCAEPVGVDDLPPAPLWASPLPGAAGAPAADAFTTPSQQVLCAAAPLTQHLGDSRNWERPWRETPPRPAGPPPLEVVRAVHKTPWVPTKWAPDEINRDDEFLCATVPEFIAQRADDGPTFMFETGAAVGAQAGEADRSAASPSRASRAASPPKASAKGSPPPTASPKVSASAASPSKRSTSPVRSQK
eukprot:TRINITY_DN27337_c0_g1_i1.p1 TRINITY_DN27337_c0_g1~~TRINITY_DN27337_c0_g1_i1.p1  ORF type:complete len:960 (+),score=232.58 TRINITY_DN27337_c0_g1_i1:364-2880(+)